MFRTTPGQRKAHRKAVAADLPGIFSFFRFFSKLQLGFALLSLLFSTVLLFIGTYAYYEANLKQSDDGDNLPFYRSVMQLYGINETMLALWPDQQPQTQHQDRLHQYQISMLFVAVISIIVELGLVCSIIFEHFKMTVLFNLVMAAGLLYHGLLLATGRGHKHPAGSLAYQIFFLVFFTCYSVAIRLKTVAANRILAKGDIELSNDQRFVSKA